MISLLKIVPRTSKTANYEVVVNGDVFRAEDGSYGSATSRPGQTVITGAISPAEHTHKFLVRHEGPLNVDTRGPVTKQIERNVQGFSPTSVERPSRVPVGPPERAGGGGSQGSPPPQAPAFGIPGRDPVPNDRVKRGMPFSDNLLADKSAIKNSRVGGLIQWQANQNPSKEIPVKAVLSANNPERPLQAIKQAVGGGSAQSGTSGLGLGASTVERTSETQVRFTITGQQAEKLESIEGATFYLEGTEAMAVGNAGVPVNGGTSGGTTANGSNGSATTGGSSNGGSSKPASQDRIIGGIPDALLGAGLFAAGATVLVLTSSGGEG